MNTFSICLCILFSIIVKPASSTLSDLFGGQDPPAPQVRQMQQFGQLGQLAQQLQQLAPNPVQLLGQIGQYGPQLLDLASQAQKLFSEDDIESTQQQSPQYGKPSVLQGQGQAQGPKYGPPIRQQQQQKQLQLPLLQQQPRQQQQSQSGLFNLNKFSPQPQEGDIYYGPELDSPPEVVHIHRHIIEHRGQSGSGYGGNSQNSQNGQNVRVFKIIHEQGNALGNGYAIGNGNGYNYGYKYGYGNGIDEFGRI